MRKNNKIKISNIPNTYTFHFNNEVTVVVQKDHELYPGYFRAGFSYTSPNDNFNRKLGRLIAMNRCLCNKIDAPHHLMYCSPDKFFAYAEQELLKYTEASLWSVDHVSAALFTMRKVLGKDYV